MKPTPMKPKIIMAQVDGSGTAVVKPVTRTSELVVQGAVHANMCAATSFPSELAASTFAADAHVPLMSVRVKVTFVAEFGKPSCIAMVRSKVPNVLTLPGPEPARYAVVNCGV